ncbi:alpha/beta fold hydrolase [Actinocatenispora rupis]|uniref:Alpha/beta hydrolase n=1 Tax=Actinocatenispora rupis TaxID=519421 RepID=A0A8J3J6U2_9ACTN|nr:alpha/beta hydrolase [Actinocatenispora rupis]GID10468.1 alpha/beta hydrolase [Actinocatenispora rupis]
MREHDLRSADGRTLHAYDTGGDGPAVFWHHGTPNIGTPPAPLLAPGLRFVSYDRPGYGGSDPHPGHTVASVAGDVAAVADALGIERFAVLGHSGGGTFALGCAALLPDRVTAAVSIAGLAPYGADGLDWFAGMSPAGTASLRAAAAGRTAKEHHTATAEDGDPGFVPADHAALDGEWSWLISVVRPAIARGPGALIDDDLSYVAPWGCDPTTITAPVLLLHGGLDRIVPAGHGRWLADHVPGADLRLHPHDGHISVLHHAAAALDWLRTAVDGDARWTATVGRGAR